MVIGLFLGNRLLHNSLRKATSCWAWQLGSGTQPLTQQSLRVRLHTAQDVRGLETDCLLHQVGRRPSAKADKDKVVLQNCYISLCV
ncbi:hypothetical protein E2C01_078833 [Portunus trituberculatus]|uniref:Uncharacterized protein n=1 Tax=Portunus trituberculatus TaxID=210409 RepID=A0A5B7IR63_PORTR|nr:hypothetical protein [Portunus trituberculatus]